MQSGTHLRVAPRRVLIAPHAVLSQRATEVDPHDRALLSVVADLVATMRSSPACVGIAAPQIGESLRVIAVDVTGHRHASSCSGLVVLANPVVVARRGRSTAREGCLSVPDFTGDITRDAEVTVEGIDPETGELRRVEANAIEARCLLHEIDHLDGILFVDRVADPISDLHARKQRGRLPAAIAASAAGHSPRRTR